MGALGEAQCSAPPEAQSRCTDLAGEETGAAATNGSGRNLYRLSVSFCAILSRFDFVISAQAFSIPNSSWRFSPFSGTLSMTAT
ncbi:hypothetical protein M0R45_018750 [Rubus argutus]|uniref:Uncharacterized protein n=1 Tax=Rubus argutus TaxID=59490 RepID=A0AAW1X560_RUBAR